MKHVIVHKDIRHATAFARGRVTSRSNFSLAFQSRRVMRLRSIRLGLVSDLRSLGSCPSLSHSSCLRKSSTTWLLSSSPLKNRTCSKLDIEGLSRGSSSCKRYLWLICSKAVDLVTLIQSYYVPNWYVSQKVPFTYVSDPLSCQGHTHPSLSKVKSSFFTTFNLFRDDIARWNGLRLDFDLIGLLQSTRRSQFWVLFITSSYFNRRCSRHERDFRS